MDGHRMFCLTNEQCASLHAADSAGVCFHPLSEWGYNIINFNIASSISKTDEEDDDDGGGEEGSDDEVDGVDLVIEGDYRDAIKALLLAGSEYDLKVPLT